MKNVVRILVVVALLAAGFFILQANQTTSAANSDYALLDSSLDSGASGLTADEVHEKLGRQPDSIDEIDKHTVVENYEYSSMFRSHTLKVHYNKAATLLMTKIVMD